MTDNQDDTGGRGGGMSGAGGQPGTFTGGSGGQAGNSGAGRSDMSQPGGGYGSEPGQQRQFDQGSGGQMGGGQSGQRGTSGFADQIREHMQVVDAEGNEMGMVDGVDGSRIKLTRKDSADGQHHWLEMNQIEAVHGDQIHLRAGGGSSESDASFGQDV